MYAILSSHPPLFESPLHVIAIDFLTIQIN